ncbi:taurine catabolism dioxygenase [Cordyceps fumosorosea ARSEF 2679]|uniref:Taurine catabolism dioxygenase n=1 Tax=Cordyceps fumosorosea (strain ARSEF 2679) TaxID=1081104 RepID=A0A167RP15_CORFA|nr:taurine catabolism dioxygenase [Cordyceps fumosorosea ARSEF 2679]OAA58784.1 taurine catabolism dioxygenase [Cordyceps fumosorosea ARSEF 2679]
MAAAATLTPPVFSAGPAGQPDIAYAPNWDTYQARTKRRVEGEALPATLPEGFPTQLRSELVWDGATVSDTYQWWYKLTEEDIAEIDSALQHFTSLGKPLGYISQETFPLPKLHATLRDVSRELHRGHGFKVVRGVPVARYTREESVAVYAGLAAHVAPSRGRQDTRRRGPDDSAEDVVLAHIKDLTATVDPHKIGAPAYTTEKQVFHTDAGDVIALLALEAAAEGGESYLASSGHVYNQLAATRPDLIRTLAEPWNNDEFGKSGPPGYTARPLLYHQPARPDADDAPERLIIQYARRSFTGYWGLPRSADIPPITEAQAEALDALHFTAERSAVALEFQAGDIQFVNNLSIFHARGSFKDSPEKQRHLVRLWLRDEELAWDTPEQLRPLWDRIYAGVTPESQVLPLEPFVRAPASGEKVPGLQ